MRDNEILIVNKDGDILTPSNGKECDSCPVCDNRRGFAFGTCVECGFNYLDGTFHYIKVDTDYLPQNIKELLINEHAKRFKAEVF